MVFSKKWLKNHPKFLSYFLMHIDALMLCRKFELNPTRNFGVMTIFRNSKFLKKAWTIAHGYFQKMAEKLPQIFIIFSDTD